MRRTHTLHNTCAAQSLSKRSSVTPNENGLETQRGREGGEVRDAQRPKERSRQMRGREAENSRSNQLLPAGLVLKPISDPRREREKAAAQERETKRGRRKWERRWMTELFRH